MLEAERRDPRAPGDTRMYLYFDYSPLGALRWYVKVSRKGRRIGIRERYGTQAFDGAYDAAVAALGGVMRKRRTEPDRLVQPERRYVQADRSQRGQTRYYVQLRNGLPKIRIGADFGSKEFDDECDAAIVSQIARFMAMRPITSTRRSSAMSRGQNCLLSRRSLTRCAGTGHSTNTATTGSVIFRSARRDCRTRRGCSAPG
jgi:hypothetical protein